MINRCLLCGDELKDWENHQVKMYSNTSYKEGGICTWDYVNHLNKGQVQEMKNNDLRL